MGTSCAETQDRTGDLQIFSTTLSQLSYRGCCKGQGALATLDQARRRMLCRCAANGWPSSSAWKTEFRLAFRRTVAGDDKQARDGAWARAAASALKRLQAKAGHDKEGFAPRSACELRLRSAFGRRPTASTRSTKAGGVSFCGAVVAVDPRSTDRLAPKRLGCQKHLRPPGPTKLPRSTKVKGATATEDKPSPQTGPPVVVFSHWAVQLTPPSARRRWSGASRDSSG
jgi:hypothetical protein